MSSTICSAHVFLHMGEYTVLPIYSRVWDHRLGTIDLTRAISYRKLILPIKPANVHSFSFRSRAHETLSPHDRMLINLTLCRSFSGKPQQLQQSRHVSSRRQCFVLLLLQSWSFFFSNDASPFGGMTVIQVSHEWLKIPLMLSLYTLISCDFLC